MVVTLLVFLVILINFIGQSNTSSFDLILNMEGRDIHFQFTEIKKFNKSHQLPSTVVLDNNESSIGLNSSCIRIYETTSNENMHSMATVFKQSSSNSNLLFVTIQLLNGSIYDIMPLMPASPHSRLKRSFKNNYVVKHNNFIVQQVHVSIHWYSHRHRRTINKLYRLPRSKKSTTKSTPVTKANKRKPAKKSRHIYLNIIALIDSLILNDVRTLLNKSEYETIEILQLYYIHIFIGIEQLYQQSLIYENFDIHIRLSKIIFATDKSRLPWESFQNVSSLSNAYRKSPNNVHLRPNISTGLLNILHPAYKLNQFDKRFFTNSVDHIMTFTRFNFIDRAGSAFVSGVCHSSFKYSIIQDELSAFIVTMTAAHELGHNLGLDHDETENECDDPNAQYIMSPVNRNTEDRPQTNRFSKCSIRQLSDFIDQANTKCWQDKIISTKDDKQLQKQINTLSNYLGQIIDLRQQCQLRYGLESIPYISMSYNNTQTLYEENVCKELKCYITLSDDFMYWQYGALDGTPCGENRICQERKCISTKAKKIKTTSHLANCPYGDLSIPVPMLDLKDKSLTGNMHCADALNLLRARGMNVTYLCYDSTLPYSRLCCEECKKHLVPECGDLHSRCSVFAQYCKMEYVRINGQPVVQLCPYTCDLCPHTRSHPVPTTTVVTTISKVSTKSSKVSSTKPSKTRPYTKPKAFTEHTCIDSADCSQLIKLYGKLKKNVKNWCTEYSTMMNDRYFAEVCPKYCSLCNITSACDRFKLCRNHGKCIKDEHDTYQCICSPTKQFYGTLCEYRRTCSNKPCSSKHEICVQTQGENYVCLSKQQKEQLYTIWNATSSNAPKNN